MSHKSPSLSGDFFGGLTAMLVALPSAIAFGILIFAPLGEGLSSVGVMAGVVGTIVIGIIAPLFGGSQKLISAPCAPAAAVLSAFALELVRTGGAPATWTLAIALVALLSGSLQILFGVLKGGRLIKYIPYPVIAGYLSGVGVLIFIGQVPKVLGIPKGQPFWEAFFNPEVWSQPAVVISGATIAAMILATRVTRILPAPIIALTAGALAYLAMTLVFPQLKSLENNPLVVGPIQGTINFQQLFVDRWGAFGEIPIEIWKRIFTTAAMLAVLLSIDTLKTCVILDAITGVRHDSNRELLGQGLGNLMSATVGGMPGAGTMGATLINISSGGNSRRSGVIEGLLALVVFVVGQQGLSWLPIPALSAILLVVGTRMIDWKSFDLLKNRGTVIDFLVIAAVIIAAVVWNLMAAAGVGLSLAILLFVREQIRSSVVRRKAFGSHMFSKRKRLKEDLEILEREGEKTVIFELQGSLFFGTTDQLLTEIDPHLKTANFIILDLRRIQSVDFTGAHLLSQIETRISEHGGLLILTSVPTNLPSGQNLLSYFDQVGVVRPKKNVRVMNELDEALEWVENSVLETQRLGQPSQLGSDRILSLADLALFRNVPPTSLQLLSHHLTEKSFEAGQTIFQAGESGDELFMIRSGIIKIQVPTGGGHLHHLATFSAGDFFGDMSFLDGGRRSANAIAASHVELYSLSRSRFDFLAQEAPQVRGILFAQIAQALAHRLRQTDLELRALEQA